ncbi:mannose-1-phosphate guanylyltransferase/mannose-6-phosphate isomerase [Thiosulfatimonas sediminis]|uniref:mannose-1-phosphate guanylyltransferase n=1 Tax=Thiosulfatimonas sediminis TaxID=2675054 RepID=A0A6F8PSM7_9GAMM|nr:mannose-1-phosphate guanylyltransferase/mannose-6-phosphate isomerase [Thiosulfatimonas sediminis]BBP45133.1 mannose-1-phosphate guanylyltransferase/mannose-6-phosphate isomerase [Thiosulfatimonas sediminis]
MINILMCGGVGSRLWPLSRAQLPKQFVRLFDQKSLFQETVLRNSSICSDTFIVSGQDQYFLALDQLGQINASSAYFLLEPMGRNTAPAIAMACMLLPKNETVLVSSADHVIKDSAAYQKAVLKAEALADEGALVTFGIQPSYPETGFGYIEADGNDVLSFKEKPSLAVAETFLQQGNYYWNSGMFCFQVGTFLDELKACSPELFAACQRAVQNIEHDDIHYRVAPELMQAIPDISIDYAVMEKSNKVKVVPCDIGWSDLGSFDALYDEVAERDASNNAVLNYSAHQPKLISIDSKNNLLVGHGRQVAFVDIEDLLVVDTSDALLISKKGSSQKVKQVAQQVKSLKPQLVEHHDLVYRPWGSYEVLAFGDKYKVKRLTVKPGCKLSLQKHLHRSEHWVVVSGTALVTIENESFLLKPNESTYIQMGNLHRLENQGKVNLVMVEVQVGEYTGEDDIIRVADDYGR